MAEEQQERLPRRERAQLRISGYGLIGNFELRRLLQSLDLEWRTRQFFDANFIEDSALILLSSLERDGYLRPEVSVEMTLEDGVMVTNRWTTLLDPPLPRPFQARAVHFRLDRGVLYQFDDIEVVDSTEFDEEEVRAFFVERGALIPLRRTRIFTPDRLERGLANVTEALNRLGYENALVTATNIVQNHQDGTVDLTIVVEEGARVMVRSVRTETFVSTNREPIVVETIQTNVPFSRLWQQDFAQDIRSTNFQRGYPDTEVEMSRIREDRINGTNEIDLLTTVKLGEQITIGEVQFKGLEKTKESVAHRRVDLDAGDLLNRIEAERGRHRLV
ncbi:MAG: POTRA domain-containing protein, partial [Limisphaerales bacterium]